MEIFPINFTPLALQLKKFLKGSVTNFWPFCAHWHPFNSSTKDTFLILKLYRHFILWNIMNISKQIFGSEVCSSRWRSLKEQTTVLPHNIAASRPPLHNLHTEWRRALLQCLHIHVFHLFWNLACWTFTRSRPIGCLRTFQKAEDQVLHWLVWRNEMYSQGASCRSLRRPWSALYGMVAVVGRAHFTNGRATL